MLAIAGGKGGCGKTTTALGLARALAACGAPVYVADGDRDAPNCHVAAGVPATPTLSDVGPEGSPAAVATEPAGLPGVRVLPAPPDADDARFVSLLSTLPVEGSRLLVDCPAGAGPDAAAPLRAADATLVVTTPTPQSLRDAAKTAAMARALDAPPVAAAVVRAGTVPEGAGSLLGVDSLVAVPAATEPLSAPAVRDALERLARVVSRAVPGWDDRASGRGPAVAPDQCRRSRASGGNRERPPE